MISLEKAQEHIFGFTMALDLTARDLMKKMGVNVYWVSPWTGFVHWAPALLPMTRCATPINYD